MQTISIGIHTLIHVTIGFWVAFLLINAFIFFYLFYKKRLSKKREHLKKICYLLIEKAIFYEPDLLKTEEDTWIKIPLKFQILFKKKWPRSMLRAEILQVQKNITGHSKENLQKLYEQLGLKQDALRKLHRLRRWYIKAEGIQELSVMNQRDCLRSIYRYVNNKNEFIRMEAQLGSINFMGFHGLRFLNILTYPMSEWQQLTLLEQLSHKQGEEFKGIERWLRSSNDSVTIFALKLVKVYRRFELHDVVSGCLNHANIEVRKNCIITLTYIYTEDTAGLLIQRYVQEDEECRLAILHALNEIRDPETIFFLTEQLQNQDNEIKLMAAKAIVAADNGGGLNVLNSYADAKNYPWSDIIQQLKEEVEV